MSKRSKPEPKMLCPVCQRIEVKSQEDVWPQWLRKLVLEEGLRAGIPNLPPKIKTPLGKRCNGRSNTLFEQPNREVITALVRGAAVQLTSEEQEGVAAWMVKTALMYTLLAEQQANRPTKGLRTHLHGMLQTGKVPPETSVRIAYVHVDRSAHLAKAGLPPLVPASPFLAHHRHLAQHGFLFYEEVIGPNVQRHISAVAGDTRLHQLWPITTDPLIISSTPTLDQVDIAAMWMAWRARTPPDALGGTFLISTLDPALAPKQSP